MDQKSIDLENLLKHFADDQDILLEVMNRYLELYPQLLSRVSLALEQKDAKELMASVHSLKGSVSHFFVIDIFSDLNEIEDCGNKSDFELAHVKINKLIPKLDRLNKELQIYVQGNLNANDN